MLKEIANERELKEVLRKAGSCLVVLVFGAKWCKPCKRMAPAVERINEKEDNVFFFKVDADKAPDVADALDVSSLPTFVLFRDGKILTSLVGDDESKLKKRIQKHK